MRGPRRPGLVQNDKVQIVGVSVDPVPTLNAWRAAQGYEFPLLSDFWPHGQVAREYGAFFEPGGMALRATFLVDQDGVVRFHRGQSARGTPRPGRLASCRRRPRRGLRPGQAMSADQRFPEFADGAAATSALAAISPWPGSPRRFVRNAGSGRPLLEAWGTAWILGALALTLLPGPAGQIVGGVVCVVAAVASWFPTSRTIHRNSRGVLARAWVALLVSSPFLVTVTGLSTADDIVRLPRRTMGSGMLLHAIVTGDRPLGLISAFELLLAAVSHVTAPQIMVLLVGVVGGPALLALGLFRLSGRQ